MRSEGKNASIYLTFISIAFALILLSRFCLLTFAFDLFFLFDFDFDLDLDLCITCNGCDAVLSECCQKTKSLREWAWLAAVACACVCLCLSLILIIYIFIYRLVLRVNPLHAITISFTQTPSI